MLGRRRKRIKPTQGSPRFPEDRPRTDGGPRRPGAYPMLFPIGINVFFGNVLSADRPRGPAPLLTPATFLASPTRYPVLRRGCTCLSRGADTWHCHPSRWFPLQGARRKPTRKKRGRAAQTTKCSPRERVRIGEARQTSDLLATTPPEIRSQPGKPLKPARSPPRTQIARI